MITADPRGQVPARNQVHQRPAASRRGEVSGGSHRQQPAGSGLRHAEPLDEERADGDDWRSDSDDHFADGGRDGHAGQR
jgi:hypothetical protein